MQDRFRATGVVGQRAVPVLGEAAAPTLGQQDHQVDERQTETSDQYRFSGSQLGQVDVGGVAGWDVGQAAALRRRQVRRACSAVGSRSRKPCASTTMSAIRMVPSDSVMRCRPSSSARSTAVPTWVSDRDPVGETVDRPVVGPSQIVRLDLPAGEVFRAQRGGRCPQSGRPEDRPPFARDPLVEGRTGNDRSLARHGLVGEDRDVAGHRVHPEQCRLSVAARSGHRRRDRGRSRGWSRDPRRAVRRRWPPTARAGQRCAGHRR